MPYRDFKMNLKYITIIGLTLFIFTGCIHFLESSTQFLAGKCVDRAMYQALARFHHGHQRVRIAVWESPKTEGVNHVQCQYWNGKWLYSSQKGIYVLEGLPEFPEPYDYTMSLSEFMFQQYEIVRDMELERYARN